MIQKLSKLSILFVIAISLGLSMTPANAIGQEAQGKSQTTTWKGTLDARGTKLRLEIEITKDGDDYSGVLNSLDQGAKLDLDDVKETKNSLKFSVPKIGAKFKGKLSKKGTVATGTFTQSGIELPLTLEKGETTATKPKVAESLKEAWVGKLDMGIIKPVMQFRIVKREDGTEGAYFDSITEGQTGFDATVSIDEGKLNFSVARIKLTFKGELNKSGDSADGIWSQGGREVPLTLKKQLTEYDNKNTWENRPQRPVAPFPYVAEEVRFNNKKDGVLLAGTLTIPKSKGPHPVAVLISGSGPQDRDETLMEHKPFLVIADYLSRRGIAVLRYDDRGTADSTGEFAPATTEDFARDASAAVEFLKSREDIIAKEIGLIGHSEGGLIAPMVYGMRDDVAFVVLLAATGVDGKTIVMSQSEAMSRAEGVSEKEIKISQKVSAVIVELALKGELQKDNPAITEVIGSVTKELPESEHEEVAKEIRKGIESQIVRLESNWMQFFLAHDPAPLLAKMKCPVLAITGTKDTQVLPELNVPMIKKSLEQAGNKDFEMVELEGLNHLFQKCKTGGMSEYATIQETFNPKALKKIGDWISDRTTVE